MYFPPLGAFNTFGDTPLPAAGSFIFRTFPGTRAQADLTAHPAGAGPETGPLQRRAPVRGPLLYGGEALILFRCLRFPSGDNSDKLGIVYFIRISKGGRCRHGREKPRTLPNAVVVPFYRDTRREPKQGAFFDQRPSVFEPCL